MNDKKRNSEGLLPILNRKAVSQWPKGYSHRARIVASNPVMKVMMGRGGDNCHSSEICKWDFGTKSMILLNAIIVSTS